jgi:decaprenylphospho-beta-D-erythro-pentofuranosid-2-ulose 2-reductase
VKAVVLGATSGMGRAVARRLAERGDALFLLGLPLAELERSAGDLEQRGAAGQNVGVSELDLADPRGFESALDKADRALGGIDTVIVTAGLFKTQDALEEDGDFLYRMLHVNFTATVLFCEAARKRLLLAGGGTLCVFSSVAGDRGRKPVVLYGATKAGLSHYLESLDHKYRAEGLRTITIKPGFVKTPMTEGLKAPPFAGDAEGVAKQVVRAIDRGTPLVYAPAIWRYVMLVIRFLPRFVMRKIGF